MYSCIINMHYKRNNYPSAAACRRQTVAEAKDMLAATCDGKAIFNQVEQYTVRLNRAQSLDGLTCRLHIASLDYLAPRIQIHVL